MRRAALYTYRKVMQVVVVNSSIKQSIHGEFAKIERPRHEPESLFCHPHELAIPREVSFADVFYRHLRTRYRTGQTRAAGKTALLRFEH